MDENDRDAVLMGKPLQRTDRVVIVPIETRTAVRSAYSLKRIDDDQSCVRMGYAPRADIRDADGSARPFRRDVQPHRLRFREGTEQLVHALLKAPLRILKREIQHVTFGRLEVAEYEPARSNGNGNIKHQP
jgi:hypothetical protein